MHKSEALICRYNFNILEEIIWKPITGFENLYKISNTGVIISLHKRNLNREIAQRIDRAGYLTVRLSKNGIVSTQYVHRLLAKAFIDRIEGKSFVNHVDGSKLNNSLENLEWVSHSENIQHAYSIGLINRTQNISRKVINICLGAIYQSIKEAAYKNRIPYSTCKNFLNGNRKNKTCLRLVA